MHKYLYCQALAGTSTFYLFTSGMNQNNSQSYQMEMTKISQIFSKIVSLPKQDLK